MKKLLNLCLGAGRPLGRIVATCQYHTIGEAPSSALSKHFIHANSFATYPTDSLGDIW